MLTSVLYKDTIPSKYLTIAVCNIHPFNTEYSFELIKNMTGFDPLNFSVRFGKLYSIYNFLIYNHFSSSFQIFFRF